jgi:hypothetical protein
VGHVEDGRLVALAPATPPLHAIRVALDEVLPPAQRSVLLLHDVAGLSTAEIAAVLGLERDGERLLPIWIGSPEGDALVLQLAGAAPARPMTHDLTARLLEASGTRVERVTITSLRDNTSTRSSPWPRPMAASRSTRGRATR